MCYALYIGSNSDLQLTPAPDWKTLSKGSSLDNAPRLVVAGFGKDSPGYAVVRKHFSEINVVYAGSFEGCGCGFFLDEYYDVETRETLINAGEKDLVDHLDKQDLATIESRKALHDYIKEHNVTTLYCCWMGEESMPPEGDLEISVEFLLDRTFVFSKRIKMSVKFG